MLKLKTCKSAFAFSRREVVNKNLRVNAPVRLRNDLESIAEAEVRINGMISMYNKILQIIVLSLALGSFIVGQTVSTTEDRISRQFSEITKGNGSWERGIQIREELERLLFHFQQLQEANN